jgi:meso-butanediol dehydrogenase/(S,S)-butanediol dehydrogenase/diacetyl reductase
MNKTTFDFNGQTAIVTGAASGIGQRMAAQLLEGGAVVYGIDRTEEGVPEGVHPRIADVSDLDSMKAVVDEAVATTGTIDMLFNNAGINAFTGIVDATVEEFDRIMAVNARGVFIGMHLVVPHMIRQGGGAIVSTSSTAAVIGILDRASYSASKGAVVVATASVPGPSTPRWSRPWWQRRPIRKPPAR